MLKGKDTFFDTSKNFRFNVLFHYKNNIKMHWNIEFTKINNL